MAVYWVFAPLGQYLRSEMHNHIGLANAVLHTPELQQIEDKGYALPYQTAPQRVVKVGVAFNEGKKNIGSWVLL